MKLYIKIAIALLVASIGLSSCENVIDPELQKVDAQLVVEAWLTNRGN